ncbi:hypothetical protein JCGZ_12413 [Jatropha curcas]|uniref:RING-type E3 ubiquitin transferase n=1 Tax=Jatropha curcas TaxID=180498 RepID=A0A067K763_JATCU|nr:E3 ubiquitin-protein ligase MBR2 [Jatropha curcas]XP_020537169.1 E3 ubiquitin-protein ligase MBR2 [Jatropha curcas]KDP31952.1 hypothetical protein JCGZ_12413 [Jatropha curcas]
MMQGQDSTSSNAHRETFYLDCGSNGINLGWDQNNVVPVDDSIHDSHPVIGWVGQSSYSINNQTPIQFQDVLAEDALLSNTNRMDQSTSSLITQTPVRFQDLLAEDGLLCSPIAGAATDQSLGMYFGPMIDPFPRRINASLENSLQAGRQSSLQQASFSAVPENTDLNEPCDGHDINANLNIATGLCLSPFKRGELDADQNPFASDPSNSSPLMISSGISGYVLEENECGEGQSSIGRRLSCKRRAPEDASAQLSFGESSRLAQQLVTTQESVSRRLNLPTPMDNHPNVRASEQTVGLGSAFVTHQPSSTAGSGFRAGGGASSGIHQTVGLVGEAAPHQRNTRPRRTANQQDFLPANLMGWTMRNSYAQLPDQSGVLVPFDCALNTSSMTGIVQPIPPMQQPVQFPYSSETLQPLQWNAVTRSRTSLPSISAYAVNGGDDFLLENNSRNNLRHDMLPPLSQRRNSEHLLTSQNFVPGINSPRNTGSGSRNGSNSHVNHLPASFWFLRGNMAQQYAQRTSDIVNHAESQRQSSYCPWHLGFSTAGRERELSASVGNARSPQMRLRSGLRTWLERQTGPHTEVALSSLTAAQRRRRLVSEVRNALALVRWGGSLHFEDVMVIDRSVLYGVPEEPDLHEDMRLDVDNMSYEELLALEEQIGDVSTGLSEDAIQAHMKRQKYEGIATGSSLENEPCCICQEDYVDGEELGKLDCGHDFHFYCIRQWLVRKNICPICKMTGLEV